MVHGDPIVADSARCLRRMSRPAPTAILSPAKRDAYLDCLLRPAEREDATLVKVIFDSGERIFLVPVHTPVGTAFLG
jgi:hypothetical protein